MAAIARRSLLALFFVPPETAIRDTLALLASDLSEGNLSGFLRHFSRDFPGREQLRYQVAALLNAHDLTSSIAIQSSSGDSSRQSAQLDWYLAGRSKSDNSIAFQRREVLTLDFSRQGNRWLITKADSLKIFAPL
ncbi:MAG: hypothetical protein K7J46_08565 [Bryobacter sp.]|jgi:hypothetical protein|nr:hypothetical protein [Bryobacter sp. CoA8 C33]